LKLQSRILIAAAAIFSAALLASCSEKLQNEAACPILCPNEGGTVQNVTLNATTMDTTVASASGTGTETGLLVAARGDSLDTRAIIRFDTIPARFIPVPGDSTTQAVTTVDSAYLLMKLDTTSIKATGSVTIEAYDVDTTTTTDSTVADTATGPVLKLFRPDRLISSQVFTKAELTDSIKYFLSNAAVLKAAQTGKRFRLGLRAVSASSVQIRILSTESGDPPHLIFRVAKDTAVHPVSLPPFSKVPFDQAVIAGHLADYTIIAKSPAAGSPFTLNMGGLPPTRVYFRFDIPASIIDSATVVRAALILTQFPNRSIDPADSISISPAVVLAGNAVTDPTKAAQILAEITLSPAKFAVGDSGRKAIELAPAFTFWHSVDVNNTPRAIVLRSGVEGSSPLQARFFSLEAPLALRPQLQISYIRRLPLGLP
jgi:hypothetical protein